MALGGHSEGLGVTVGLPEDTLEILGDTFGALGCTLWAFGGSWGQVGVAFGAHGGPFDVLGCTLGAIWGLLGLLWGAWGTYLRYFGSTLAQCLWFFGAPQVFSANVCHFLPPVRKPCNTHCFLKVFQVAGCILEAHWGLLEKLLVFLGTHMGYSKSYWEHFGCFHGYIEGCLCHF